LQENSFTTSEAKASFQWPIVQIVSIAFNIMLKQITFYFILF